MIKLRWIACIWNQNERKCYVRSQTIQNNAKIQKWSKYNDMHRYDVKSDQITWICIDLTSKRSKLLSYVANHSKPLSYKVIKIQWLAPICCQKHQNNAKLRKGSNWTSIRAKMMSYVAKKFKTTLNYKSNQITMNCIDLMSKTSKQC